MRALQILDVSGNLAAALLGENPLIGGVGTRGRKPVVSFFALWTMD